MLAEQQLLYSLNQKMAIEFEEFAPSTEKLNKKQAGFSKTHKHNSLGIMWVKFAGFLTVMLWFQYNSFVFCTMSNLFFDYLASHSH